MQLVIAGRSYELSETLESEQLAPIFDDAWTASRVWMASQYLSEHLVEFAETQQQPLQLKDGATVIELGSGCGLAGLVAASLGGDVLLTDQQQAVDLLVRNIDTNAAGTSERDRLHATEFTWGTDPATYLPRSTYEYILVSDCKSSIRMDLDLALGDVLTWSISMLCQASIRSTAPSRGAIWRAALLL